MKDETQTARTATQQDIIMHRQRPHVVIFSRSGESEYKWLVDILSDNWPVSPFIITNNNQGQFCQEVYRCSFGILYHSQNRGRVNITDVTDSLYDVEVKTMSEALGKERVITVIDDLDDSSEQAKERILGYQHSLKTLTRDIFLFTRKEKANGELLRRRVRSIRDAIVHSVGAGHSTDSSIPVSVPEQGSDEVAPRTRKENMRRIGILGLTSVVLWIIYTEGPVRENVVLAVLWLAVTARSFYIHESRRLIPLVSWGRIALSGAITFGIVYDTYHRPSTLSVLSSGLWIASRLRYHWPGRHQRSTGQICQMINYGLVLMVFWRGWRHSDVETILQMLSLLILRSPAILAAEGV